MTGSIGPKKKQVALSKPAKRASLEAHEEPQNDSVYDFLYQDARRVGSFLAQFDDAGHLQQITQGDTAAKEKRAGYKVELTAGLGEAMGLPGGGVSLERSPAEAGSLSSHRTYDPLWTNARAFLDYLAGADLIERDATKAAIGQFILVTGQIFVIDTAMLKSLTAGPLFRQHIHSETKAPSGPRQAKAAARTPNPIDLGIEMLNSMPSTVQARVATNTNDAYWGSLAVDGLTSSAGDLMLKHGIQLAGEWSMLGILDAVPDQDHDESQTEMQNATTVATLGVVIGSLAVMADTLRPMLGRPSDAYGITPLLVFREIAARG